MAPVNGLMVGKKGLIMGVANDHSIAWGIASALHRHGAEMAFTHQGGAFGRRVGPLAESVGSTIVLPCDVEDDPSGDAVFAGPTEERGAIELLVYAIGLVRTAERMGRSGATTLE